MMPKSGVRIKPLLNSSQRQIVYFCFFLSQSTQQNQLYLKAVSLSRACQLNFKMFLDVKK